MKRVDGYLSSKAQAAWPDALVYCDRFTSGNLDVWTLERPGETPVGLGANFRMAKQAVDAIVRAAAMLEKKCVAALKRCVYAMDLYMDGKEDANEIVAALHEAKRVITDQEKILKGAPEGG